MDGSVMAAMVMISIKPEMYDLGEVGDEVICRQPAAF